MILTLHYLIEKIVPIHGVADNGDGSYRVDYINEPDLDKLEQVNNILSSWPLEKAKIEKLEQLDQEWANTIKKGWITPYGWKLGLSTEDIALLNGNFTLAKEAASMGLNSPVFVIDTDEESHEFNLQDLTVLMLQYGQARATLSAQDAVKRKSIQHATNMNELDNITI